MDRSLVLENEPTSNKNGSPLSQTTGAHNSVQGFDKAMLRILL